MGSAVYLSSKRSTNTEHIDDIDFVYFRRHGVDKSTAKQLEHRIIKGIEARHAAIRNLKTQAIPYVDETQYFSFLHTVFRYNARRLAKGLIYWKVDGKKHDIEIPSDEHRVKSLKKYIEILLLTEGMTSEYKKWRDTYLSLSKTACDLKTLITDIRETLKVSGLDYEKDNWHLYYESYEDILHDIGCAPVVREI